MDADGHLGAGDGAVGLTADRGSVGEDGEVVVLGREVRVGRLGLLGRGRRRRGGRGRGGGGGWHSGGGRPGGRSEAIALEARVSALGLEGLVELRARDEAQVDEDTAKAPLMLAVAALEVEGFLELPLIDEPELEGEEGAEHGHEHVRLSGRIRGGGGAGRGEGWTRAAAMGEDKAEAGQGGRAGQGPPHLGARMEGAEREGGSAGSAQDEAEGGLEQGESPAGLVSLLA